MDSTGGKAGQYMTCLILHLFFPFIPLIIEFIAVDSLFDMQTSITITAAMYALSISISSNYTWHLALGIFLGTVLTGIHGITLIKDVDNESILYICITINAIVFIIHAIERYIRHYIDEEIFFAFSGKSKTEKK